jgi:hypothetical protein
MTMPRVCFFTSIALNYLPKALALAESVFDVYPKTRFVISISDISTLSSTQRDRLTEIAQNFANRGNTLEYLDPLPLYERPDLLVFKFNVVELCTCVKPAIALRLLESAENVTYLDPDTILYTTLPTESDPFAIGDVEVTPHALAPSPPHSAISERFFMYYGVFNLGYFGVRRSPQTLKFLKWWQDFCVDFGAVAPQTGLFVDQKPVDLLPCFVDRVRVVRHPGCNVAWWNLFADGRRLTSTRTISFDGIEVPLVFFHFSNLHRPANVSQRKIANPLPDPTRALAAGMPSTLLADHPILHELFAEYDQLTGAFDADCSTVNAPASSRQRRAVPLTVRLLIAEALRCGMSFDGDPFELSDWQVARRCIGYLLRRMTLRDAWLIVRSNLLYAKLSFSTRLLRQIR